MRRWVLAAALLAAGFASQAMAADLDDGEPPRWKEREYGYQKNPPPPPSWYDDEDDRGGPYGKKYSDAPSYKGCVRSEQVRDRLTNRGWRDFHAGKAISPTMVTLRARRPSGRLFELRLDRCSGEIIAARPLELSPYNRPFAYNDERPDGRWRDRPYGDDDRYDYRPRGYMGPYAWRDRPYNGRRPRDWED